MGENQSGRTQAEYECTSEIMSRLHYKKFGSDIPVEKKSICIMELRDRREIGTVILVSEIQRSHYLGAVYWDR